jgi:hypothetical protein
MAKTHSNDLVSDGAFLVTRECDRCELEFKSKRLIDQQNSSSGKEDAKEMKRKMRKADDTVEVFCPTCKRFTKKALAQHFSEGFCEGLLEKFEKLQPSPTLNRVFMGLSFVGIFGAVALAYYLLMAKKLLLVYVMPLFIISYIAVFVLLLMRVFLIVRCRVALKSMTEKKARQFALKEYARTGNTLDFEDHLLPLWPGWDQLGKRYLQTAPRFWIFSKKKPSEPPVGREGWFYSELKDGLFKRFLKFSAGKSSWLYVSSGVA